MTQCKDEQDIITKNHYGVLCKTFKENQSCKTLKSRHLNLDHIFLNL